MRKYNQLTLRHQYLLTQWLDMKRNLVKTNSDEELAQQAMNELGFKITKSNVKGVINDVLLITRDGDQIDELESRVRQLEEIVIKLSEKLKERDQSSFIIQ